MALRIRLLTVATLALTAAPVYAGCPVISSLESDGAQFVDLFGNATVDRALQDSSGTVAANFGPERPAADAALTGADFWQGPMFDSSSEAADLFVAGSVELMGINYDFLATASGGARSVPEPSAVVLGGIALAGMVFGRRFVRRRSG
ncbi:MAG: PEP-CTERM sorting domain-containing protein [Planctomycetia bacterium]|nr:PEP-CTERM sorting domain-containing protein [Planctomycetia bacterium]